MGGVFWGERVVLMGGWCCWVGGVNGWVVLMGGLC